MANLTATTYPTYQPTATPALDVLQLLPSNLISELGVFPFEKTPTGIKIAATQPYNPTLQEFARQRFGQNIEWFTATSEDVLAVLRNYPPDFKLQIQNLVDSQARDNNNISLIVSLIIRYAILEKASDIHIEPLKTETHIRFRVDGILHDVLTLPTNIHESTVARLKILGDLKIDEYRRPQDGRIEIDNNISFRISIIPTLHGEKVALRVLDDSHRDLSLDHLGFSSEHQQILARNMEKPFGMIISSGPTGSGKTTSLYSLLAQLKRDNINISTLEDPIEYSLPGINQIQINKRNDLTFTTGLRALLRQDPDVILIGEIRDSETAVMAADAALTGHLVFTTIHTNDAPSTFNRFLEMGVEDFLVGSVINLVIAQRLVRKVCPHCAKPTTLKDSTIKKIKQRSDVIAAMHKRGMDNVDQVLAAPFMVGSGCVACLMTGFSGRVGLFELLELNQEIHNLILKRAPTNQIKQQAESQGFKNLISDGLDKIFNGVTTFEEVLRSTRNPDSVS